MADQDAGRCPDSNSGLHRWRIKRTQFKRGNKYVFRECTACGKEDLVITENVPKRGRHRKG